MEFRREEKNGHGLCKNRNSNLCVEVQRMRVLWLYERQLGSDINLVMAFKNWMWKINTEGDQLLSPLNFSKSKGKCALIQSLIDLDLKLMFLEGKQFLKDGTVRALKDDTISAVR